MTSIKIVSIFYEKPFCNNKASSNPSVAWMESSFDQHYDFKFIMRGGGDEDNVISFPESSSTVDTIKKFFFNSEFRADFRKKKKLTINAIKEANVVWVRAPSLVPLWLSSFWKSDVRHKLVIHVCANRFTLDRLVKSVSLNNVGRFFYGLVLKFVFFILSRKGVKFFNTGTHVANNFSIKNSDNLIDFIVNEDALQNSGNGRGLVCLGRMSKINDNTELRRFLSVINENIDVYGPGEFSDRAPFINKGVVDSKSVIYELSKYETLVCITEEYYEGFPRVIAEAVTLGMYVVISKKSTFVADMFDYPKLIFSEDVLCKNDFNTKLIEGAACRQGIDDFIRKIKTQSVAKLSH